MSNIPTRPCDSFRKFELVDELADALTGKPGVTPLQHRPTNPGHCRLCGARLKDAFVVGFADERATRIISYTEASEKGLFARFEAISKGEPHPPGVSSVYPVLFCDALTTPDEAGRDIYDHAKRAIKARDHRANQDREQAEKVATGKSWE